MKVKFFSNYDSSEDLLKRFNNNYGPRDSSIEYTVDDYDVAVVFNRTNEFIKSNKKVVTIIQEPSWSPANYNNPFLTTSDLLFVHDQDLFEKVHNIRLKGTVIEHPSIMWYHDHVPFSFFNGTEKVKKKKKISMIVSGINMENVGNYKKRLNLLKQILESDLDIDIFGRGLNINDSRYKGALENKFSGLLPYKYSIAIENSNERNYLTEKFIDCFMCNTMPIYNGAPNVDEIFDRKSYETIDLVSPSIIGDLKTIIENDNKFSSAHLFENKVKYFSEYNLHNILKAHLC